MDRCAGLQRVSVLFLAFFTTFSSSYASQSPRLIQTSPGQREWMTEEQIFDLARKQHETGRCGGFMDLTHRDPASLAHKWVSFFDPTRSVSHSKLVLPLLPEISGEEIQKTVEALSSYNDRFYQFQNGADAAQWIKKRFEALARGRSDITTELFTHSFKQPSVIVRIPGKGPHAQERVILGAHEDSINMFGGFGSGSPAPGADDDASGVATLLEIFRVLVQSGYQPDRTLEFMTYAGEEEGLLGSQDIAQKYSNEKTQVEGVMQFDMTMFPGAGVSLNFIVDDVNRELTRFTQEVADTYVKTPWKTSKCGYACSDHASWTDAGYASVFPFEATFETYNKNIHTENDTLSVLDSQLGTLFAKLGLAWAIEMASE